MQIRRCNRAGGFACIMPETILDECAQTIKITYLKKRNCPRSFEQSR